MWSEKLGIDDFKESDEAMIIELDSILQKVETDMTIFFRMLSHIEKPDIELLSEAFYDSENIPIDEWNEWLSKRSQRVGAVS